MNDVDDEQNAVGGFSSTPKPTKLLRFVIQIVQLAARKKCTVFVQTAKHGSGEFGHDDGGLQLQMHLGCLRGRPNGAAGVTKCVHRMLRLLVMQFQQKRIDAVSARLL